MRVAYFSETLPPLTDGVTRTLARLADSLQSEGVEFQFFSAMAPDGSVRWRDRCYRVPSLPFLPYDYYRIGLPLFNTLDGPLDAFAPDVVHAVNPTPLGLYGIAYARRRGIPVVSSYHTDFVSYFPYYGLRGWEWLGWRYLRWFYNQCDMTFAPSRAAERELHTEGIEHVALWARGIDPAAFSPAHRSEALRRQLAPGVPILLFVGRLVREKNLAVLADACDLLDQAGDAYRLVLVGDGPMRSELERRLPAAYFAGFRHGADLAALYASADVFVFPSVTETFGNVILEALASRLPVVAAAHGGALDLVQSGVNGFLAEPGSAFALACRVRELLVDPARRARLATGALATAAGHRWPEVNGQLLAGYDRLVAHGSRLTSAA